MSGNGNGGRVVEFSAAMKPVSRLAIVETQHDPDGGTSEAQRAAKGGLMMLRILSMPLEERVRVLTDAAADPLLIWFALLTREERLEVVRLAETQAKDEVTR